MSPILLAGLGGFVGSSLRYLLAGAVQQWVHKSWMPLGTLTVNMLGCLVIGILGGLAELRGCFSLEMKAFLLVGVLGGFTTYSTFAFDSLQLFKGAGFVQALGYIGLHLILGLAAVFAGFGLIQLLNR